MSHVATASIPPTCGEDDEIFHPDDYLLGIVRRAVTDEQDVVITLPAVGDLRVLPRRGEYFTSFAEDQMKQFCCRPANAYTVKKLGAREAEGFGKAAGLGRNLDELMWHTAICASRGRLMQGCRRDDVILLRHWPNLTRLTATPNAVRISALLTRYPTSATVAHRLLGIPAAELNAFYSAARCAGLAVAVNRKPELTQQDDLKPHRQRGLLALFLNRITGM